MKMVIYIYFLKNKYSIHRSLLQSITKNSNFGQLFDEYCVLIQFKRKKLDKLKH